MRLTQIDDSYKLKTADQGKQQFIVFTDEGKVLGLAVEEILDIVKQPMSISMNSTSDGFLGSMVIAGKTTDVVDVGHYFSKVFKDWRIHQEEKDRIKRGAKILLVEDSPFFRKLMVPVLMTRGYEIKTASDGVQALKVLSEDKSFNLIITDIDMPNMNGLDFAEKCKSDDSIKNIPIIALTANNNIETIKRGRKIGLANHIAKSDREKLFETVVDIIEPKLEAIHA
jgi:two-component system chemotaxis sensor kinase CheA